MARTSTRTGRRAHDAHRPWPTRREREGGARPAGVPQQRHSAEPAAAVHPGAVPRVRDAPSRGRSDAATDALLASVPPFGTAPFGTRAGGAAARGSGGRPHTAARLRRHHGAAGPPVPVVARNGAGVAALCLALTGMPFALVPPTGLVAALLGALAVAFGLLGRFRARRGVATNPTMSVVAASLGLLTLGLGVAGMVILFRATGTVVADVDDLGARLLRP